jgi:hypothetical protein
MGRPRKVTPARPYHLTLEAVLADRIDAYAASVRKRPTTTAARLVEEAVCRAEAGEAPAGQADELTRAREQIRELEDRVSRLRVKLSQETADVDTEADDGAHLDGDAGGIASERESEREIVGRRASRGRRGAAAARPRWEWPLEKLLADDAWWDRWLPRLYELLGDQLH